MNTYNIIATIMLFLTVIIANTDDHKRLQMSSAVLLYVLLFVILVVKVMG